MEITATLVKKLRDRTGAGMSDCKSALVESNGDIENAIDILRKKGQKVASKREDREVNEGFVVSRLTDDKKNGFLVALNCETDFVANNGDFQKMVNNIIDIAEKTNSKSLDELNSQKYEDITVAEKVIEQIGVIGEKLELRFYKVEAESIISYIHGNGKIGCLVGFNKNTDNKEDMTLNLALQVVSMGAIALDEKDVPQSELDREFEIGKELAIQEGKTPEMAEKIAQGRLGKFLKECTLLNQMIFNDNSKSVKQYLQLIEKDLQITEFKKLTTGN